MPRIALLLLSLAVPLMAHGEMYKWIDKDGRVQYSDQPPPANARQQKKIDIKTAPPAPVAPSKEQAEQKTEEPKTAAEQDLEFKKRKLKEEEEEAKQAAEAKQRQENCNTAKGRLKGLEEVARIFTYDAKGERVYADDASREKMLQEAQQDVSKWCR